MNEKELEIELAEVRAKLAHVKAMGPDDWPIATIIYVTWLRPFNADEQHMLRAAFLKTAPETWVSTSRVTVDSWSWEEVVTWVYEMEVHEVWVSVARATAYTTYPADVDDLWAPFWTVRRNRDRDREREEMRKRGQDRR